MFNETKRDARAEDAYSGATEMKRKRRNVDTRAGKKCIFGMEFSGNTGRYTMGHQFTMTWNESQYYLPL